VVKKEFLQFSPKSESVKFYHFLVKGIHFDHIAVDFEMQNLHDVIFDGNSFRLKNEEIRC